ncbi:hypothetical protein [Gemmatimonas sp.]|uniref:hypothetical protein n=1 Tax=Gemmatimonas sp. TaxID=1962908 RepID=UPI00286DF972|nr:hypothetical protein [Gemmatimonas sp.]
MNAWLPGARSALAQGASRHPAVGDTAQVSADDVRGKLKVNTAPTRMSVNMTVARTRHDLDMNGAAVEVSGSLTPK